MFGKTVIAIMRTEKKRIFPTFVSERCRIRSRKSSIVGIVDGMEKAIIAVQISLHQMIFAHGQKGEMMDDLVRREDVYNTLSNWMYDRTDNRTLNEVVEIIPSAQHEIIHCEKCEHWKNNHLCECLSRYGTFETPKDFYCGYGKAK